MHTAIRSPHRHAAETFRESTLAAHVPILPPPLRSCPNSPAAARSQVSKERVSATYPAIEDTADALRRRAYRTASSDTLVVLNPARRVVVCIAAGLALAIVAAGANHLMTTTPDGGWFMYSPGTEPTFSSSRSDSDVIRAGAVWLIAVGAWLLFSWWLFRERRR
jgi:hypothetical protein